MKNPHFINKSISRFFILSVIFHGVGVIVSLLLNQKQLNEHQAKPNEVISLEIVEPPIKKGDKIKDLSKDMRIVDQDKINEVIDPKANLLSSHNQKVNKETVAKNHGKFQNKKMMDKPKQAAHLEPETMKPPALPKDLFGSYKDSLSKVLEKKVNQQNKELDAKNNQEGVDVSQSRDYLPDKEAGLETLLSTREFVYYTYYNRIRNQLSEYWEPKIKQKVLTMFRQGRRIASTDDRITKLQIILDSRGILQRVQVLGASGVQDLDEVAVDAFRAAAPFPNPPKGIIESDGTVKIEWDFIVET